MKKKSQRSYIEAKLEMAAMIDVVFLLLIFFILALKPMDVLAHLDVSKGTPPPETIEDIPLLRIDVYPESYVINGKQLTLQQMDKALTKLAGISKTQSIVVTCSSSSSHSGLVKVLNICAKVDMNNISLMSR
ncbi:biopolymer transporter ExbD [Verrucomicrobiota bacterium]